MQVTFRQGGHLRWSYGNDPYIGGRSMRAVTARYLAADAAGAQEWSYGVTRDSAASAVAHMSAAMTDASGNGAKTWSFLNPAGAGSAWQIGLVSEFVQRASVTGAVFTDDTYTWTQNAWGNPYISGTQNNGQISQVVDTLPGETVSYQYDARVRFRIRGRRLRHGVRRISTMDSGI